MKRAKKVLPSVLILSALLFLATGIGNRIIYTNDGDGRFVSHKGIIYVRGRGLNYAEGYYAGNGAAWDLTITLDFPVVLIAGMCGVWLLVRDIRTGERTHRSSSCHYCGYDLRATPERCPECGKPHV
jgi:hypothetical protein